MMRVLLLEMNDKILICLLIEMMRRHIPLIFIRYSAPKYDLNLNRILDAD